MNDTSTSSIDPRQARELLVLRHDRQLLACRFSPCGRFVFAAATDRFVHRWELETGTHTAFDAHLSWVGGLGFHPDGKRLVTADYVGAVHCWNYADAEPKPLWSIAEAHPDSIRTVSISIDGKAVITAGHDGKVRIRSADDGQLLHTLTGHESPVYASTVHPDGQSLVTADQSGGVLHWDIRTGKLLRRLDASILWQDESLSGGARSCGVRGLTFGDDGTTLACSGITELKDGDRRGGNASILMLDWKSGTRRELLQAKGAGYAERTVFAGADLIIAACLTQEFGSIRFWSRETPEAMHSIKSNCRDLDLHPDGERFAVAEWDKNGKAGNNASTKELEEFSSHNGLIRVYSLIPEPAAAAGNS